MNWKNNFKSERCMTGAVKSGQNGKTFRDEEKLNWEGSIPYSWVGVKAG